MAEQVSTDNGAVRGNDRKLFLGGARQILFRLSR